MSFRQAYMSLLGHFGNQVTVFKSYGAPAQSSVVVPKAMQNTKTKRGGGDVFQFPDRIDVVPGDVIQQKGSNDLWYVTDTEDIMAGGEFTYFQAAVEKGKPGGSRKPAQHGPNTVNVHGPVYGGLQVGNTNSSQSVVNVSVNTKLDELIGQVLEGARRENVNPTDIEEVEHELQRVKELAQREKTPDITERINKRLAVVQNLLGVCKTAGPYVASIIEMFHHPPH
jgi:hypothetical protein